MEKYIRKEETMKYIARFKLEKNVIKSDYRSTFVSFFKKSILNYMDGYFYDEFYDSGAVKKDLTWSIRLDKPEFKGEEIILATNSIELTLIVSDDKTALVYYSAILGMKNVQFNIGDDNNITLTQIKMVQDADIISDIVEFKILSPICIRKHEREGNVDTYYSIADEEFGFHLNRVLKEDLKYYDDEVDALLFNFEGLRKTVVPVYGIKIPVTIGTFIVKGNTQVLNLIKNRGVGQRRNSGFGTLEAINK